MTNLDLAVDQLAETVAGPWPRLRAIGARDWHGRWSGQQILSMRWHDRGTAEALAELRTHRAAVIRAARRDLLNAIGAPSKVWHLPMRTLRTLPAFRRAVEAR